jgi:uncharacterized protein (DUF342 family)
MNTDPTPAREQELSMQQGPEDGQPADPPTKPVIILKVTRDNLELELQFQRSGTNTSDPLYEDVMAEIAALGIVYGVNESNIRHLCEKPVYNRVFVVARGASPKVGEDGYLKFLVDTNHELRPKIREDGTADFKDLGLVSNVTKDMPLCEVHPPEKGEDGMDLYGNVLEGKYGKEANPPIGTNTALNEEKTMVVALVDGNVEYRKGAINIMDVLRIGGNVDNSTGDIDFVGDVIVNGYVVSGFKIKSQGSVVVKGGVEGAGIEARGDITINEGMNGMNRGTLVAGGNIKCRYIQSCFIKAEQDIYADTVMYCTLECSGNVELSGKRAALIGGRSSIAGRLIAKTIGTDSHVATEIRMVSTGLLKSRELEELSRSIARMDGEITKLVQVMTRFDDLQKKGARLDADQLKGLATVKENYVTLAQQRKDAAAQLEHSKLEQLDASGENSYIECKGRVHTGVKITFGPLNMLVRESFVNSRIHTYDGEIAVATL